MSDVFCPRCGKYHEMTSGGCSAPIQAWAASPSVMLDEKDRHIAALTSERDTALRERDETRELVEALLDDDGAENYDRGIKAAVAWRAAGWRPRGER